MYPTRSVESFDYPHQYQESYYQPSGSPTPRQPPLPTSRSRTSLTSFKKDSSPSPQKRVYRSDSRPETPSKRRELEQENLSPSQYTKSLPYEEFSQSSVSPYQNIPTYSQREPSSIRRSAEPGTGMASDNTDLDNSSHRTARSDSAQRVPSPRKSASREPSSEYTPLAHLQSSPSRVEADEPQFSQEMAPTASRRDYQPIAPVPSMRKSYENILQEPTLSTVQPSLLPADEQVSSAAALHSADVDQDEAALSRSMPLPSLRRQYTDKEIEQSLDHAAVEEPMETVSAAGFADSAPADQYKAPLPAVRRQGSENAEQHALSDVTAEEPIKQMSADITQQESALVVSAPLPSLRRQHTNEEIEQQGMLVDAEEESTTVSAPVPSFRTSRTKDDLEQPGLIDDYTVEEGSLVSRHLDFPDEGQQDEALSRSAPVPSMRRQRTDEDIQSQPLLNQTIEEPSELFPADVDEQQVATSMSVPLPSTRRHHAREEREPSVPMDLAGEDILEPASADVSQQDAQLSISAPIPSLRMQRAADEVEEQVEPFDHADEHHASPVRPLHSSDIGQQEVTVSKSAPLPSVRKQRLDSELEQQTSLERADDELVTAAALSHVGEQEAVISKSAPVPSMRSQRSKESIEPQTSIDAAALEVVESQADDIELSRQMPPYPSARSRKSKAIEDMEEEVLIGSCSL